MTHDIKYAEIIHSMSQEGGGLIEIYVLCTSADDWRRTVEWMREENLIDSFTYMDEEVPAQVTSDLFEENGDTSFQMAIQIGRQVWTTGFYSSTEIDFQGDPRSIRSVEDLVQIVDFMKGLSQVMSKRVVLVSETVDPANAKPYIAVEDWYNVK